MLLSFNVWYASPLMCFEPGGADACVGDEGYAELCDVLHRLLDDAFYCVELGAEGIDNNLIVHLKYHLRAYAFLAEAAEISIIANFIISAALPCMGAFMALRSATPRATALRELISCR